MYFRWWKWRKTQGSGNFEGYVVLLLYYISLLVKQIRILPITRGRLWINIWFTSLAGLTHSNNDSHKQTKKKKGGVESKHTSHSAGYHISKQTKLQGLERSDLLCSDVALLNTNWTATAETAGEATTPSWSQRVGLSHPYTLEPPKLCETLSQRCCKTLRDSQSAPKKPAGCSAPRGGTSIPAEEEKEEGGQEASTEFPEICFLKRGARGLAEDEKPGWGFAS